MAVSRRAAPRLSAVATRARRHAPRQPRPRVSPRCQAAETAGMAAAPLSEEERRAFIYSGSGTPETLPFERSRRAGSSVGAGEPLRVIIAGGGLGGLVLAGACHLKGMHVRVIEQAPAYMGYGGPIQVQSNALAALADISKDLYDKMAELGTVTADRISGLRDGITGRWLCEFDTKEPAVAKGLPLTLAIERPLLQTILLQSCVPPEFVHNNCRLAGYAEQADGTLVVELEDGTALEGDVLVGADGIWSTVRQLIKGAPIDRRGREFARENGASYTGYVCYTAACFHVPKDVDTVSYKVLLGRDKYAGLTDAGNGRYHFWAFIGQDENKPHPEGMSYKEFLEQEFDGWVDLPAVLKDTRDEDIARRVMYDRKPMLGGWSKGSVTLLGDAAHAMMPNLGQGGNMAFEDARKLADILAGVQNIQDVPAALKEYENARIVRCAACQGFSRSGSDVLGEYHKIFIFRPLGELIVKFIQWSQPFMLRFLYVPEA